MPDSIVCLMKPNKNFWNFSSKHFLSLNLKYHSQFKFKQIEFKHCVLLADKIFHWVSGIFGKYCFTVRNLHRSESERKNEWKNDDLLGWFSDLNRFLNERDMNSIELPAKYSGINKQKYWIKDKLSFTFSQLNLFRLNSILVSSKAKEKT